MPGKIKKPELELGVDKATKLEKAPATVYLEKSATKNMGDYNSAKVTVGVTLPINYTKEDLKGVEATIEVLDAILDEHIVAQLKELTK